MDNADEINGFQKSKMKHVSKMLDIVFAVLTLDNLCLWNLQFYGVYTFSVTGLS